ncbi:MAG TPA: CHAT domain-containing protein [Ktedonobacteraceae bacterium]|nr:CHAT domain-containing protein [Ktedonobacteraceae bacterium]
MDYLNFELEIAAGNGSEYPVTVMRSPGGEAYETMHFPFDEQALKNQLAALQNVLLSPDGPSPQIPSAGKQTIQDFGQALFEALFTGKVHDLYVASRSEAIMQGKGLRVKLRIHPPELAALPWEFLYDPGQAKYLCLSNITPLVRYFEIPEPFQPLSVTVPLCVLGVTACPKNLADLDIEREKQRIEEALAGLQAKGLVKLTWLAGRTWQDVQQAMLAGPWHILHFIGHGGFDPHMNEGMIVLEDRAGQARYLSAAQFVLLLTDHPSLRLVVLNSCKGAQSSTHDIFSSTAATLVRGGIPAVLANQYAITDQAAIELSRAFYEALAAGMPIDTAIGEARKAITLSGVNTAEWGTPVLSVHIPNGVLFNLQQTPATSTGTLDAASPATAPAQPSRSPLPSSTSGSLAPTLTTPATALITTPSAAPVPVLKSQQLEKPALEAKPFNPMLYIGLAVLVIALIAGSVGVILANHVTTKKAIVKGITATLGAATTTAQEVANATATVVDDPYPPTTGKLAFDDPLSKPYQWDVYPTDSSGGTCQFTNGTYHVSATKPPYSLSCPARVQFSNFTFEVQMTIIHGDCGGTIFREDVTGTKFYYFEVCSSGSYGLYLYLDNKVSKTLASNPSPAITPGLNQPMTIAVVANGSTLDLYVNHQKIDSVTDRAYTGGYLAFDVDAQGNPTEVAFSNARAWTL